MWISRQFGKAEQPIVETGKVTLNSNGELEAVSTGVQRDFSVFSPFGYCFSLPQGEDMLLIESSGEQASLGVVMKNENLQTGEVKITSSGGAYIHLRNDGTVVINGVEISKEGVIND